MSFNEQAALDFLSGKEQEDVAPVENTPKEDLSAEEFLKSAPDPVTKVEPVTQGGMVKPFTDYATAFNNEFLDLLGFPGDMFDWAAEKLGSDLRVGGSAELRELGKDIGMGTDTPGEEPDTGSYRAGKYTAQGLAFLAPFLAWANKVKLGTAIQAPANAIAGTNTARGTTGLVSEKIVQPFIASPKAAATVELVSGAGAGYGSYYGEEEFGPTGEMVGGLVGGIVPTIPLYNLNRVRNYVLESFVPYTSAGAKQRAAGIIRGLAESPDVRKNIEAALKKTDPNVNITPAKLSGDPHLQALERVIVDQDPAMARELRIQDQVNSAISRANLRGMKGEGAVEDAQNVLGSKFMKLMNRLNARVDLAVKNVSDSTSGIYSAKSRSEVNKSVMQQINNALKDARSVENKMWGEIDKSTFTGLNKTRQAFAGHLADRFKADDPAEIPNFLTKFIGRLDDAGNLRKGVFKDNEIPVGELHALRSRLLKEIRLEKAKDVPDWNKVRIMDEVETSMLDDLSLSGQGEKFNDALNFSRALNQKFKGDIMSNIMRHSKTGGGMAPELTLEGLGTGPKGAVQIRKILTASPESKSNIEDVLKMDIARSRAIKDGRVDLNKAKEYMKHNEEIMDMFPTLKKQMNEAIGLEEKARWYEKTGKSRSAKAKRSLSYKLSESKPGTVLSNILSSKNAEVEMERQLRRLNSKGKQGIANDVIDLLMSKSKTNELDPQGLPILSGKKAVGFWNENKNILSKAFSEQERKRLNVIINTMRAGDGATDLPLHAASEAMKPKRTALGYVVEVAAARIGSKLGSGTSGASLKTASQGANTARKVMGNLDIGAAQKLLKDAIKDRELFMALSEDVNKIGSNKKSLQVLQSWMVAHAIQEMQEAKEEIDAP